MSLISRIRKIMFQSSSLPSGRDKERVFLFNQQDMILRILRNPHTCPPQAGNLSFGKGEGSIVHFLKITLLIG